MPLLLTLSKLTLCSSVSIVNFKQVIAGWEKQCSSTTNPPVKTEYFSFRLKVTLYESYIQNTKMFIFLNYLFFMTLQYQNLYTCMIKFSLQ